MRERFQRRFGNVMLNPFGVGLGNLGSDAITPLPCRAATASSEQGAQAAWERDRNVHHTKSDWHFTTKDARIKLKHLHPSI
jgi:hypothetical protein